MDHLKNSQIAQKLGITKTTVGKYIQDRLQDKNELELIPVGEAHKIADTPKNWQLLDKMVESGRRFYRHDSHKVVEVTSEFYELFDEQSKFEIFRDLDINKEIPLKFHYRKNGAISWDQKYKQKVSQITVQNETLVKNLSSPLNQKFNNQPFNLIDIGCGNGSPANLLLQKCPVSSYLAIDVSKEMLDICQENIRRQFPDLEVNTMVADVQKNSLEALEFKNESGSVLLFIGNTICNYNKNERLGILNNFVNAMTRQDTLLISYSLDSEKNKQELNYVRDKDLKRIWLPTLLGIDLKNCLDDPQWDDKNQSKIKYLLLKYPYTIKYQYQGKKHEIFLNAGERIVMWKHFLLSLEQVCAELASVGLKVDFLQVSGDNVMVATSLRIN